MADIIPIAIGCGISEERSYTMTFAELMEEIEILQQDRRRKNQFLDLLNAKFCSVYASFKGVESRPADFMVTTENEDPPLDMTPECIQERAFGALSKAGG